MIIKNNYNAKGIDPLNDYEKIGKGSHSLDREFQKEKDGFIKENMQDPLLQNLRGEDEEIEEETREDKWDFFR